MKLQTTSMEKETKVEQTVKFTYINMYGDTDLFLEISTYLKDRGYGQWVSRKEIIAEDIPQFVKENPSVKLQLDSSLHRHGKMFYEVVTFILRTYATSITENIGSEHADFIHQAVEKFHNSDKEKLYTDNEKFLMKFSREYAQPISLTSLSDKEQEYVEKCMLTYKKKHRFTSAYTNRNSGELVLRYVFGALKNTYGDAVEVMKNGLFSVAVITIAEQNKKYLISLFGIDELISHSTIPIALIDTNAIRHIKEYNQFTQTDDEKNIVNLLLSFVEILEKFTRN